MEKLLRWRMADSTVRYRGKISKSLYTTLELLGSNGADWFNDDYTQAVGDWFWSNQGHLTKIKELRTVYGSPNPTAVGVDTSHSPTQMFMTDRLLLFLSVPMHFRNCHSQNQSGAGLPPKMAEGTKPIGSANLDCIWRIQHPEEAFELVQYLTSVDNDSDVYKTGLWMPNRVSLFKEENQDKWYNFNPVYPEGGWIWHGCDRSVPEAIWPSAQYGWNLIHVPFIWRLFL